MDNLTLKLDAQLFCKILQQHDTAEKIFYAYLERFPENQQVFQAFRNTPLLMLKVMNFTC